MDEIFRIAHSLKGMSATMGFAGMAKLTHEMEDVFELLRQRRGGLERDAVDVLLECLDALSEAVDAIDATGEEQIEPEPLIERLRDLVRDRTPEQEAAREGFSETPDFVRELAATQRVVQVSAILSEHVQMPGVRAYMVLSALAEMGEMIACCPAEDAMDGFAGGEVAAWIVTDRRESDLTGVAASVPDVADVQGFVVAADDVPVVDDEVAEQAVREAMKPDSGTPKPAAAHGKGSQTVRVDAERLDQLMHFMGERVTHRTAVEALAAQADVPGLSQAMQNLTRTSHALQQMVMQVRMIPVEAVFMRLVSDALTKGGHEVVGEAGKGAEAITRFQELKPEVTTLDAGCTVAGMRWAARTLEDVPVVPVADGEEQPAWHPLQHFFSLTAFGANVFVATSADQTLIELHDESASGQEELYVVLEGEAEFELDGDTLPAPRGTVIAVPERAVRRRAVARSSGTAVLAVGTSPGCFATTWRPSHFANVPRADAAQEPGR